MARKTKPSQANSYSGPTSDVAAPPDANDSLASVAELLDAGKPERALTVLARAGARSPALTNALGVCQLRLGRAATALAIFRGLVVEGHLTLRADVPTVYKTNYAVALLLTDNLSGCLRVLDEIPDTQHPAVQRLRSAVRDWSKSLTFWQRLSWYAGGHPGRPVALAFPAGDLD